MLHILLCSVLIKTRFRSEESAVQSHTGELRFCRQEIPFWLMLASLAKIFWFKCLINFDLSNASEVSYVIAKQNFNEILFFCEEDHFEWDLNCEWCHDEPQAVSVTRVNHWWSWNSPRLLWTSRSMIECGDTCWCHAGERFASHFFFFP